jgi:hypothetical protein
VGNPVEDASGGWSQRVLDLSAYAGRRIRLGFYHMVDVSSESTGWYLDDIELSQNLHTNLPLSEDIPNAFVESGERHHYVIHLPPGGHLWITLTGLNGNCSNELYARHGALPSAGKYDYRYSELGGTNQEVFIPDATPGAWYILVYGDCPKGAGSYTIRADFETGLIIQNIIPAQVGNTAPAFLTIDGAGFDSAAEVVVVQGATEIPVDTISYVSNTRLLAELDPTGLTPGTYQVRVSSGPDSDEIGIEIIDGIVAAFETTLILPSHLGNHAPATIWVEYANIGEVAMPAPLLVLTATQGDRQAALLTLDSTLSARGYWTGAMPKGFSNNVQFLAAGDTPGILQPGESFRVPVQWAGWQLPWDFSGLLFNFSLGVLHANNDTPVDWNSLKDGM